MGVDRRIAFLLLVGLTGCSMAPDYRPPATPVPRDFKELEGWTAATPMDQAPRGQWWEAFGDPVLNDLEARAEQASPTLAAALARYDQAKASAGIERADLFPQVNAGGEASRQRLSGNRFGGKGAAPV